MNTLYKLKIVFAYYVSENFTKFHKWHLINFNNMLLNNLDNDYFNDINFYLLIDDVNNEELINKTKNDILSYISNNFIIKFHIVQNNPNYREGLIYKTEIIDKFDQYDEDQLILFMHTKGVSNNLNLENYENTLYWIGIMYYFNLLNVYSIFEKFYNENIITYGTIYNYDDSSLTKYKWQYTGSFHWIYPYKFLNYLKDNNLSYDNLKHKYNSNTFIKYCAEAFIGDNIETKYAGFLDDHLFNKNCSHFLYDNSNLPYSNITYVCTELMHPNNYDRFLYYLIDLKNNGNYDEITNDIQFLHS